MKAREEKGKSQHYEGTGYPLPQKNLLFIQNQYFKTTLVILQISEAKEKKLAGTSYTKQKLNCTNKNY